MLSLEQEVNDQLCTLMKILTESYISKWFKCDVKDNPIAFKVMLSHFSTEQTKRTNNLLLFLSWWSLKLQQFWSQVRRSWTFCLVLVTLVKNGKWYKHGLGLSSFTRKLAKFQKSYWCNLHAFKSCHLSCQNVRIAYCKFVLPLHATTTGYFIACRSRLPLNITGLQNSNTFKTHVTSFSIETKKYICWFW